MRRAGGAAFTRRAARSTFPPHGRPDLRREERRRHAKGTPLLQGAPHPGALRGLQGPRALPGELRRFFQKFGADAGDRPGLEALPGARASTPPTTATSAGWRSPRRSRSSCAPPSCGGATTSPSVWPRRSGRRGRIAELECLVHVNPERGMSRGRDVCLFGGGFGGVLDALFLHGTSVAAWRRGPWHGTCMGRVRRPRPSCPSCAERSADSSLPPFRRSHDGARASPRPRPHPHRG